MKNRDLENRKLNAPRNSTNQREKSLPWWVELLFVQIGLPDKLLIKILKSKKNIDTIIKDKKYLIFKLLILFLTIGYFYPVVKEAKNKLECERVTKNYLLENEKYNKSHKNKLRMLSTSFCNGGEAIIEINKLKR